MGPNRNNQENRRRWRSPVGIAGDRRGATLLEFALVAAPFLTLLLAMVQTSLVYFAQVSLETGVEAVARGIVTGQRQAADAAGSAAGMTKTQLAERFRRAGCSAMPAYLSCSRLYVQVKSATTWSAADASAPVLSYDVDGRITTALPYDLGGQGSIVVVRFLYLWPIQATPMINLSNAPRGQRLLMAISVAKSEPYS